jgi:ribosome maturation protein Sdo1
MVQLALFAHRIKLNNLYEECKRSWIKSERRSLITHMHKSTINIQQAMHSAGFQIRMALHETPPAPHA